MGGYGYTGDHYTRFTAGSKTDEPLGPAIRRPFVPFVPNSNREVATGPYGDDNGGHGYSTKAYPRRDDDGYWHRQTSPVLSRPQRADDYLTKAQNEASQDDGYYGNYNDKEWHKPTGSSIRDRSDNYDRYQPPVRYSSLEPNRTSGGGGWSRPNVSSGWAAPPRNDNYDMYQPTDSYGSRPNIGSGWTPPPRNGTQLSEPTNDIGKALRQLEEAAKVNGHGEYGNKVSYTHDYRLTNNKGNSPIFPMGAEPMARFNPGVTYGYGNGRPTKKYN